MIQIGIELLPSGTDRGSGNPNRQVNTRTRQHAEGED
jgi:hypothetical protein